MSIPLRAPSTISISKASSDRIAPSKVTMMIEGSITGVITFQKVITVLAPSVLDASSKDASIFLKAGVNSITLIAIVPVIRCTNTIPHQEKTSKGALSMNGSRFTRALFTRPRSLSNRMIQPKVIVRVGRNSAIQKPSSSQLRHGRFVRAIAHASEMPTTNAITCCASASMMVLLIASAMRGSVKTVCQFPSPMATGFRPNRVVSKLLRSRMKSG